MREADTNLPHGNLELWTFRSKQLEPAQRHRQALLAEYRARVGWARMKESQKEVADGG